MSLGRQAGIILPGYDPLRVTNPPVIGTASSASGTSVSVAFTAPSCIGGAAITSYTAYACCGIRTATGASSPLVVTGLTTGQSYVFRVFANNLYGPSYPSGASNSAVPVAQGQQAYTTPGSYTWVAPSCVTSVSIVAVGSGGGPGQYSIYAAGGGGLGYKNNYSVTPGNSYTVVVGAVGSESNGGNSYFVNSSVVQGGGGNGQFSRAGGTYVGDGGGNGGTGGNGVNCGCYLAGGGGGGAGGYSGNGGNGANAGFANAAGSAGSGGGGGGGSFRYSLNYSGSSGGGVGLLGQGANGAAGASGGGGGGGGSCGTNGTTVTSYPQSVPGGVYGGGGGARNFNISTGGSGAVRIIWPGTTRQFPSTNTGNL